MDELQETLEGGLEETFSSSNATILLGLRSYLETYETVTLCMVPTWRHQVIPGQQQVKVMPVFIHPNGCRFAERFMGPCRISPEFMLAREDFPATMHLKYTINLWNEKLLSPHFLTKQIFLFLQLSHLILDWKALFVQHKHPFSRTKSRLHLSPTKCQNKVQGSWCLYFSKSTFFSLISQNLSNKLL